MRKADVQIQTIYRFYNEFTVGGGKGQNNIHGYVLRDFQGRPYLPASLIKGNILHSVSMFKDMFPCLNLLELFGGEGNEKGTLYFDNAAMMGDLLCGDAPAPDPLLLAHSVSLRTGVTISRYTRSKRESMLRTIETTGQAGTMLFQGEIQGFIMNPQIAVPALVAAIRFPVAFGGSKSRGLGWFAEKPVCTVLIDGEEIKDLCGWAGMAV